jgi:hypothetical protein
MLKTKVMAHCEVSMHLCYMLLHAGNNTLAFFGFSSTTKDYNRNVYYVMDKGSDLDAEYAKTVYDGDTFIKHPYGVAVLGDNLYVEGFHNGGARSIYKVSDIWTWTESGQVGSLWTPISGLW